MERVPSQEIEYNHCIYGLTKLLSHVEEYIM